MKVLVTIIVLLTTSSSHSNDTQKVAEVFVSKYAEVQIKKQIETFINQNPSIVLSKIPTAGTKAMYFIGKFLAAHGLITAETDKQRLFAAANLAIPFDPTSAMILVGVQVVDMIISMERQKNVMKIYLQAKYLESEAIRIYTQALTQEVQYQLDVLNLIDLKNREIIDSYLELQAHPITDYFTGKSQIAPSEDDIAYAFSLIGSLRKLFTDYEILYRMFEQLANTNTFYTENIDVNGFKIFLDFVQQQKDQIEQIYKPVSLVLSKNKAAKNLLKINKQRQKRRQVLRTYVYCANLINQSTKHQTLENHSPYQEKSELIVECQEIIKERSRNNV